MTEFDPVADLSAAVQRQLARAGVKPAARPMLLADAERQAVRTIAANLSKHSEAAPQRTAAMGRPDAVAICAAARAAAERDELAPQAPRHRGFAEDERAALHMPLRAVDLAGRVPSAPLSGLAAVFAAAHNRHPSTAELRALA